jgi:hypothetical protein
VRANFFQSGTIAFCRSPNIATTPFQVTENAATEQAHGNRRLLSVNGIEQKSLCDRIDHWRSATN